MSDRLVASHWTLAGARFGEPSPWRFSRRVRAAAEAGFWGIGMHVDDYISQRSAGLSDEEMLRDLEAHGVVVDEIEFLSGWSSDDEAIRRRALAVEGTLYRLADAVGARQLNAGSSEPLEGGPSLEVVAERFAGVCERAAAHGLLVAIEFMPWTAIPDLAAARRVAAAAGRENGGILLDSWHFFRGEPDYDALRLVPPERIFGVQLNDGPAEPDGDLRDEARHRRRLPGQGDFDLPSLIRALRKHGVDAPWAVEVMSEPQASQQLLLTARAAFEATEVVLKQAGAG